MTYPTHSILNNTTRIPDRNTRTRRIQQPDILLPRNLPGPTNTTRHLVRLQSPMPHPRDRDEEQKNEDLQDQTCQNDILAQLHITVVVGFD